MRLFSPWALWFLSFLPLIVLMYILKQKFEERQISSIYLWQQVLKDIEVNTPWQRLKKNLLLFLQLLSVLLLVFALSDPFVYTKGGMYSNLVIVIDNTGSMNARYEGHTRLEQAKRMAEEAINRSGTKTNITLLTMERSPRVELGKTTDKNEALGRLKAIKPGNSSGNINEAVSLVKAMVKQYEGSSAYKAVFYTDSPMDAGELNAEVVSLASELYNASLDFISYAYEGGRLTVMVRATNRSKEPLLREISLFGSDRVLDIKTVELQPGETKTLYFEGISAETPYLWAEFSEKDDLEADNQVFTVLKYTKPKKVLLVSDGNVFAEKALSNIKGLELYKTNPDEEKHEGYELYIFDAVAPEALPGTGSLLFINPPAGNGIAEVGTETDGGAAEIKKHPITKYMENADFTIAKLKSLEKPYWADVLINAGGNAAVLSGEYKGRKTAIIGFDLHSSDFALTTEYPIFIYNLAAYLVGLEADGRTSYVCGDAVEPEMNPEADAAEIRDPLGNLHKLELVYPMLPFDKTGQPGVYDFIQKIGDKSDISSFAVNFPVETESVNNPEVAAESRKAVDAGKALGGMGLQQLLLGLLLLLAAIEWVVYIRGY